MLIAAVPSDAAELALSDASQLADPAGVRYVWISGPVGKQSVEDARVVSYAANLISHGPNLLKPAVISDGKTVLARIDTRAYTTTPKDWQDYAQAWEEFRYDPKFNAFLTQGQVDLSGIEVEGTQRRWEVRDGKRWLVHEWAKDTLKRDGVVRRRPAHLTKSWDQLAKMLKTEAPVVEHRYWLYRAMSTIRDKGKLYSAIYGGMYYDLACIPEGGNDLDKLLSQLGVGDGFQGKKAREIFELLRSDQRVALFRSQVTGKPRRVEFLRTLAGREGRLGLFSITTDFGDSDIDVDQSPLANLLEVKRARAHEVIWEKPNGLHGFALYDANFKRQDSVPDDVAKDHLQPFPHGGRLQPAFGCIRCHASDDGWREAKNDVKHMLDTKRWDIFGDTSRKDQSDAINRIVGLYAGDLSTPFRRGRNDYASAILRVTGPWPGSSDQTDTVKQAAKRMEWIFANYWYDQVDAKSALEEMGVQPEGKAEDQLANMLMVPADTVEPPALTALRTGLKVNRAEWDLIYGRVVR